MDSASLLVFLVGAFAAAFVTGLAGFAFGVIAAAIWLHALPPVETTTLIVAYALLVQGYAVWKLRHALRVDRLWPLVLGSALGIPCGRCAAAVGFAVSTARCRRRAADRLSHSTICGGRGSRRSGKPGRSPTAP